MLFCRYLSNRTFVVKYNMPITNWTYSTQIWCTASASNVRKIQKKTNEYSSTYYRCTLVHKKRKSTQGPQHTNLSKLSVHPNSLAHQLLLFGRHDRLFTFSLFSVLVWSSNVFVIYSCTPTATSMLEAASAKKSRRLLL